MNNNKLLWKNITNITYTTLNQLILLLRLISITSTLLMQLNIWLNTIHYLPYMILVLMYVNTLPSQRNYFVVLPTDPYEGNDIILSLKSDSAPGWDNIPTLFVQLAKTEVIPIITHAANLCKGIFPALPKQSLIEPVYERGDNKRNKQYRPISVLPVFHKILEKLINKRLINYVDKFNILSDSQFGFRHARSTYTCPRIQRVEQTKYLGVVLDQRLCWYPHLEHAIIRIRKLTWIFQVTKVYHAKQIC